jgi:hypothetical protein
VWAEKNIVIVIRKVFPYRIYLLMASLLFNLKKNKKARILLMKINYHHKLNQHWHSFDNLKWVCVRPICTDVFFVIASISTRELNAPITRNLLACCLNCPSSLYMSFVLYKIVCSIKLIQMMAEPWGWCIGKGNKFILCLKHEFFLH